MTELTDQIMVRGLRVRGNHGVFEQERENGQDFVIDATLWVPTWPAAQSDDLADTVNYAALVDKLARVVASDSVNLIETLAERLVAVCGSDDRVTAVEVVVHKPQAPLGHAVADVAVRVHRERQPVVLALGSNLGDRMAYLRAALADLQTVEGLQLTGVSPVVETAPVGGPDQDNYLNAVVTAVTWLPAAHLLQHTQGIETRHGRQRDIRWGSRTLDLDIITYGDCVSHAPALQLPHPRVAGRAFVLVPWAALVPDAVLRTDAGWRSVAELAELATDRDGIRPRPDLTLHLASVV